MSPGPSKAFRPQYLHWWHYSILVALIVVVEVGRGILAGDGLTEVVVGLPDVLYRWTPLLAGVAISIHRAGRRARAAGLRLALAAMVFMVGLDLVGSLADRPAGTRAVLTASGEVRQMADEPTGPSSGSLHVLVQWASGDLPDVHEQLPRYPRGHPRPIVVRALPEAGFLLLVLATIGLVLAASRWVGAHVHFDRAENERGAHVVLGWLIAGLVTAIVTVWTLRLEQSVLFGEGRLWLMLLPSLTLFALGAAGVWFAGRPEEPSPDAEPEA